MKKLFIWPFLLLMSVLSYGQTMTTVTATITDPLSQPFANGTVQATYQRPANAQGITPLSAGVPIVEQGVANNANLDGSGVFTLSLADLSTVLPPGGTWRFNVCANATTPCAQLTSQSVIGASIDLSSSLSAQVSTIIVNAQPTLSRAYADAEIIRAAGVVWLDVTLNALKYIDAVNVIHIIGAGGGGSGTVVGTGTAGSIAKWISTIGIGNAAASDIVAAFTSCSGVQYLGADGGCHNANSGFSGLTAGVIPQATSPSTIANSSPVLDNGNTLANTLSYAGSGGINALILSTGTAPVACGAATGCWTAAEAATLGTPTATDDYIRADSTAHAYLISLNGGAEFNSLMNLASLPASIVGLFSGCSGTLYLGADGACHSTGAGSGFTGSGTLNTVTKFTGSTALGNSSITDNGTTPTRMPNGMDVALGPGTYEIANDGTTGTVINKLACDNGSGAAIICSHTTSTTNTPLGIVVAGAGTTGNAVLCTIFTCSVIADNTTVAKHWSISSSTVDGDIHDTGAVTETLGQPNYFVISANGGAGTAANVRLFTPDSISSGTCANCVTIATPGTGVLHTAGTRVATVSPVIGSDMTNNTITATQLAAQYSKGSCTEVWGGSGTANAMASGDDAIVNNSCYNDSAVTRTITALKCRADNAANTTVLTPTFGSAGTGTAILTGTVTCGNSYAYSATGTLNNTAWTTGTGIDPGMSTVGNATSIAMIVEYTY